MRRASVYTTLLPLGNTRGWDGYKVRENASSSFSFSRHDTASSSSLPDAASALSHSIMNGISVAEDQMSGEFKPVSKALSAIILFFFPYMKWDDRKSQ